MWNADRVQFKGVCYLGDSQLIYRFVENWMVCQKNKLKQLHEGVAYTDPVRPEHLNK